MGSQEQPTVVHLAVACDFGLYAGVCSQHDTRPNMSERSCHHRRTRASLRQATSSMTPCRAQYPFQGLRGSQMAKHLSSESVVLAVEETRDVLLHSALAPMIQLSGVAAGRCAGEPSQSKACRQEWHHSRSCRFNSPAPARHISGRMVMGLERPLAVHNKQERPHNHKEGTLWH